MAVLTLILMGGSGLFYNAFGEALDSGLVHEILGAVLFVLWVIHIVWNRAWIKGFLNLVPYRAAFVAIYPWQSCNGHNACTRRLRDIRLCCTWPLEIPYAPATVFLPGFGTRLLAVRTRLHRHHCAVRDGRATQETNFHLQTELR